MNQSNFEPPKAEDHLPTQEEIDASIPSEEEMKEHLEQSAEDFLSGKTVQQMVEEFENPVIELSAESFDKLKDAIGDIPDPITLPKLEINNTIQKKMVADVGMTLNEFYIFTRQLFSYDRFMQYTGCKQDNTKRVFKEAVQQGFIRPVENGGELVFEPTHIGLQVKHRCVNFLMVHLTKDNLQKRSDLKKELN